MRPTQGVSGLYLTVADLLVPLPINNMVVGFFLALDGQIRTRSNSNQVYVYDQI